MKKLLANEISSVTIKVINKGFTMKKPVIAEKSAPPVGPYSQGIKVGNLLFVSGQGPFDKNGQRVGATFEDQVTQTFNNIEAIATAAGTDMSQMVRLGVFLSNMDNFKTFNEMSKNRLLQPYPTRVTVPASLRGFDIELDAIFFVPETEGVICHGTDSMP